jgi:tRNA A-37 threonylcarbamoyl transferase component Bud32
MPTIREINLSFLHPNIAPTDLNDNSMLLTSAEIAYIKELLQTKPDGRYSKKMFVNPAVPHNPASNLGKYGIIKLQGEIYAIYKGAKHSKHIYFVAGKNFPHYKKIKLLQNLTTGAFGILKIHSLPAPSLSIEVDPGKLGEITVNRSELDKCYENIRDEFDKLKTAGLVEGHVFAHYTKRKRCDFYIVMPMVPGFPLHSYLDYNFKILPVRLISLALRILRDVRNLHANNRLHCDIKCENIMYDPVADQQKLIDFESLTEMDNTHSVLKPVSGTDIYIAPELALSMQLINNKKYYRFDEYTDAYAVGMVLKAMLHFPIYLHRALAEITLNPGEEEGQVYFLGKEKEFAQNDPDIVAVVNSLTSSTKQDRSMSDRAQPVVADAVLPAEEKEPAAGPRKFVLDEPIRIFETIYQRMLADRAKTPLKTALINVEDIAPYLHKIDFTRLREAFKQFDEIVLTTHSPDLDNKTLMWVQRRLIEEDNTHCRVPYYSKCLVVDDMAGLIDIPAHFKAKKEDVPRSFVYFDAARIVADNAEQKTVATQRREIARLQLIENDIGVVKVEEAKTVGQYLQEISHVNAKDYDSIIKKLGKERDRLHKKYKLNQLTNEDYDHDPKAALVRYRWSALTMVIKNFEYMSNKRNLSYATMSNMLNHLMHDEKFIVKPRSTLARFFHGNATCVNRIEKIAAAITAQNTKGMRR